MPESSSPQPRFRLLFGALVALVLVYPHAEYYAPELQLNLFIRLAVLAGAIRALHRKRVVRWVLAALAAAPLLGGMFPGHGPDWLPLASLVCEFLFYAAMVGLLNLAVFHRAGVTSATVYGAACTYLMIALAFGVAYQIAEVTVPGSFVLPEWVAEASLERALFYFSLVTLTTLGYGDITPVSDAVRSLVVIQSIVGILFPAIMISRVVALYSSGDGELPFEPRAPLTARRRSGSFSLEVLFATQLIQLAAYPYVSVGVTSLLEIAILLAVLGSLHAHGAPRAQLAIGLVLGIPALAGTELWDMGSNVAVAGSIALTLYLAFAALAVGAHVFRLRQVDRGAIFGICSAYLLIGATFSSAYRVAHALDAGALSIDGNLPPGEVFAVSIYLSYVTLTTLGFGDVLPLAGAAQSLATLEAVAGVLFPAVLIARLVSLYSSGRSQA